jgi:hypothetical protein
MGLRALHETLCPKATRTNGNHALDDVKPLAQGVTGRVEQGANALLLVIVQQRPTKTVGTQGRLKHHQSSTTPTNPNKMGGTIKNQLRPAKKITAKPADSTKMAVPRSGCLTIKPRGTINNKPATTKSKGRNWPSRF